MLFSHKKHYHFGQPTPNGVYVAVIPLFVKKIINNESPVINGNGEYSRDFTYIKNVVQMNLLALETTNDNAVNQLYNTAFGERITLNQLFEYLKEFLSEFDSEVGNVAVLHGDYRAGDIPYSLASINKVKSLLNYNSQYSVKAGLKEE
jgi:UDP-N-acetylglucosamine 4-epimerase